VSAADVTMFREKFPQKWKARSIPKLSGGRIRGRSMDFLSGIYAQRIPIKMFRKDVKY
jgi:hypothetical protein